MKIFVEKFFVNRYDKFKKMGEYEESVIKNEEFVD